MARNHLRPLFDRVVIKELDPDRVRQLRASVVPPGIPRAAAPARHRAGDRARVSTGGRRAGVSMPVHPGRPRGLPRVRRRLDRGRRGTPAGLPRRRAARRSRAGWSSARRPPGRRRSATADRGSAGIGRRAPAGQRLVVNSALRKRQMSATGSARRPDLHAVDVTVHAEVTRRSLTGAVEVADAAVIGRRAGRRRAPSGAVRPHGRPPGTVDEQAAPSVPSNVPAALMPLAVPHRRPAPPATCGTAPLTVADVERHARRWPGRVQPVGAAVVSWSPPLPTTYL